MLPRHLICFEAHAKMAHPQMIESTTLQILKQFGELVDTHGLSVAFGRLLAERYQRSAILGPSKI